MWELQRYALKPRSCLILLCFEMRTVASPPAGPAVYGSELILVSLAFILSIAGLTGGAQKIPYEILLATNVHVHYVLFYLMVSRVGSY